MANIFSKIFNLEKPATTTKKKKRRVSDEVNKVRPNKARMQMNELIKAVENAELPDNPDYTKLYAIYKAVEKDEEYITQLQNAMDKVIAEPFALSVDGTDNDELTELFKRPWFDQFISTCFKAEMWGYTVAEAGQMDADGELESFNHIQHTNVFPHNRNIIINEGDTEGIPIGDNPEQLYLLELGKPADLGRLHIIAKPVIWKSFSERDWSEFNERWGKPIVTISTDAEGKELDAIEKAAANLGSNNYMVGDFDNDDIKLLQANGQGNAHITFKDNIALQDKKIAKLINGQEATSNEKSFVGSAEVQERTFNDRHHSRLRKYSNIINYELLDFLRYMGYPLPEKGVKFRYTCMDDKQGAPIEDNEPNNDTPPTPPTPPVAKKKSRGKTLVSAGLLDDWLKRFYEGVQGIDPAIWESTFKALLNGVENAGISFESTWDYADLATQLRENAAVFSAFKNHDEQKALSALLVDENGKPRSWSEFYKEAKPLTETYNIDWLKTEQNQAKSSAEMALKWKELEEAAELYPNLRYSAVIDEDTRSDHREWDGIVLPIEHPFWNEHYPPNGWNCRCTVVQTDEPVTPAPEGTPDQGFDNNPGKDGKLFADSNGYMADVPENEAAEITEQVTTLLNKQ